jgi:hypothetical protein
MNDPRDELSDRFGIGNVGVATGTVVATRCGAVGTGLIPVDENTRSPIKPPRLTIRATPSAQ